MSIYIYDFTFHYGKDDKTFKPAETTEFLNKIAKKWGFQQELGEINGSEHLQGRFSLIKKCSKNRVVSMLKGSPLEGAHISPTSNNCVDKGIYHYCDKIATRKPGTEPFKDTDPPKPTMTRQLKDFRELTPYPWQVEVASIATEYDPRSIYLIIDPNGNNGKSVFCESLEYDGIISEIPMMNSLEDIRQFVCSQRRNGIKRNCYIIDMPRGMKKDKIAQFWTGIETIKNGYATDKRYSAHIERFDRPQILVFTNDIPKELDCMSKDRWKIKYLDNTTKSLKDNAPDLEELFQKQYVTVPNPYDTDSDEM